MKRTNSHRINYPQGSISHGTMHPEDLIPAFATELQWLSKRKDTGVPAKDRRAHRKLVADIDANMDGDGGYYASDESVADLDALFDALQAYAGPYWYFGAHPGDGSDYGFWLSEAWDEDFQDKLQWHGACQIGANPNDASIKVNDISEIPAGFRGEVAVVNDHGNVTLYVKTARTLREIWSVV